MSSTTHTSPPPITRGANHLRANNPPFPSHCDCGIVKGALLPFFFSSHFFLSRMGKRIILSQFSTSNANLHRGYWLSSGFLLFPSEEEEEVLPLSLHTVAVLGLMSFFCLLLDEPHPPLLP